MAELRDVVFDARHASTLARFWDGVLDTHVRPPLDDEDLAWIAEHGLDPEDLPSEGLDPVDGSGMRIFFNVVPDPTPGKNRVHIDVNLRDADELQRPGPRGHGGLPAGGPSGPVVDPGRPGGKPVLRLHARRLKPGRRLPARLGRVRAMGWASMRLRTR